MLVRKKNVRKMFAVFLFFVFINLKASGHPLAFGLSIYMYIFIK